MTLTLPPLSCERVAAIHTLDVTGDIRKVAFWLGHQTIRSTEIYLRADPVEKLDILETGIPPSLRKGSLNDAPDRLPAKLKDTKVD